MKIKINYQYPSIEYLKKRAAQRIPKFAMEYLDGGCNEQINVVKNTEEIRRIELKPYYLRTHQEADLKTELWGHVYDAPFGISPVGLQGLMWPGSAEILAKSAYDHNLPFILSTVTTASVEKIGEITHGRYWFQLYHPAEESVKKDLLDRVERSGCQTLVLLSDVPTFGYRPWDMRNGLAMPPHMSVSNIIQMISKPAWLWNTMIKGQPEFASLKKYMPKNLNMKQLGAYMDQTFSGRLNEDRIATIRDRWKGRLVLKGLATPEDVVTAKRLGVDGVMVSNHGGRQLDAGPSAIQSLKDIVAQKPSGIKILMDSGVRSGPDIARVLASGAEFAFMGRSFMYGVSAMGHEGGDQVCSILKTQLTQILNQLCCPNPQSLPTHLYP
jgi:L-lactate dehydrogenase (cytochrome)